MVQQAKMRAVRLFAVALSVVMALVMCSSAFAATITIQNPAAGETYTAYKLFDVSVSGDADAYAYSTDDENLVNALQGDTKAGLTFTKAASENTWYLTGGLVDETDAANLAKYIHDNWKQTFQSIFGDGTTGTGATITVGEGYYFVDSSLGSLCALNTVGDTATIYEKNTIPFITKEVLEDSSGEYGENATIDVIDTVSYRLTVNTGTNAYGNVVGTGIESNYVITDVLPAGIKFKEGTLKVKVGDTPWTAADGDYTVEPGENNSVVITLLASGKLGQLSSEDSNIVITYDASVTTDDLATNFEHKNTVTLEYANQTDDDYAVVKTFEIGGDSFTKVDESNNPLANVVFQLSKTVGYETQYAVVTNGYLTKWSTNAKEATDLTTDAEGHITVKGLDADTYTLTETQTLDGYNLLDGTITVVINDGGKVTYDLVSASDTDSAAETITVVNQSGTVLPSTGGIGTTIFYIVGGVLVAGAVVLLITKRRMNANK